MSEGVSQKPNVGTYPNSTLVSDLDPSFQSKVESFISALQSACASICILSTRRSKERAYLMHYAWGIAQGQISPAAVPQMYGIDIRWDYGDDAVSQQAAKQMVDFFGMTNDAALNSRHIQGLAIDMSVIPYAAMSETSSNCWKFSVINEASCWEYVVDKPSRTSWMAA